MVEEIKRVEKNAQQIASLKNGPEAFAQLSKKEANDILALWIQEYPEVEEEKESQRPSEDEIA